MKNEIYGSLLESVLSRIDEISSKTLGSYIKKASQERDWTKQRGDAHAAEAEKNNDDHKRWQASANYEVSAKRAKGIERAQKRVDEAPQGMSDKEYYEHEFGTAAKAKFKKQYGPDARFDAAKGVVRDATPKVGMKLHGGGEIKDIYSKKIVTGATKKFAVVHHDGKETHHRVDQTKFHVIHEEALNEGPSGIKPEGEKAFAGRHKIEIVDHGISNEVQHTAHDIGKDKSKKASYEDGEDELAYHGHHTPLSTTDLGVKGKLKEGKDDSSYHADAAERHQKAAEAARADGKKMLAKQHEKQAAKHRDIYKKHQELKEAFSHRTAGSHGVIHPDDAKWHKVGEYVDFYEKGTGDKKYGQVTKNDGKNIHIKHEKKTHKYSVGKNYPGLVHEAEQIEEISKELAGRYVDANREKGKKDIDDYMSSKGDEKKALSKKIDKRRDGLNRAMKKLQEEGNSFAEIISEISSKVLGSYVKKATDSATMNAHSAGGSAARGGEFHGPDFKKAVKRINGIKKATDKLVKKSGE